MANVRIWTGPLGFRLQLKNSVVKIDVIERKKCDLKTYMSHDMRFPTMWYVQPAKPQASLRIRAFASRLNIL